MAGKINVYENLVRFFGTKIGQFVPTTLRQYSLPILQRAKPKSETNVVNKSPLIKEIFITPLSPFLRILVLLQDITEILCHFAWT